MHDAIQIGSNREYIFWKLSSYCWKYGEIIIRYCCIWNISAACLSTALWEKLRWENWKNSSKFNTFELTNLAENFFGDTSEKIELYSWEINIQIYPIKFLIIHNILRRDIDKKLSQFFSYEKYIVWYLALNSSLQFTIRTTGRIRNYSKIQVEILKSLLYI